MQAAAPVPPGSEKKKRRKKGGRGERDGEAPAAVAPATGGAVPLMRIVSYFGHWICNCGKESALWDTCACGQARLACPSTRFVAVNADHQGIGSPS